MNFDDVRCHVEGKAGTERAGSKQSQPSDKATRLREAPMGSEGSTFFDEMTQTRPRSLRPFAGLGLVRVMESRDEFENCHRGRCEWRDATRIPVQSQTDREPAQETMNAANSREDEVHPDMFTQAAMVGLSSCTLLLSSRTPAGLAGTTEVAKVDLPSETEYPRPDFDLPLSSSD